MPPSRLPGRRFIGCALGTAPAETQGCTLLPHGSRPIRSCACSTCIDCPIRGEHAMAELVVVGFDNPTDADRVLTELTRMQKEYLIDLEDAVIAIRSQDGAVRIKQSVNMLSLGAATGGLRGAMWGSLIGLLFLNPLAGFAIGGAVGAG